MADCPDNDYKECNICYEQFNKTTRRPFKCSISECGKECCMECFKEYIMKSDESDPTCMFCNTHFSLEQIFPQITQSMFNEILRKQGKISLSKEKSLLSDTQPEAMQYKRQLEIKQEIKDLKIQTNKIFKDMQDKMWTEYIRATLEIRQKRSILEEEKEKNEKTRAVFMYPCPDADCKGYVSSAWKCGICKKRFCYLLQTNNFRPSLVYHTTTF